MCTICAEYRPYNDGCEYRDLTPAGTTQPAFGTTSPGQSGQSNSATAVYSYEQIAYQLTNGYWGGDGRERSFDISVGGTITFNISELTSGAQELAILALASWSAVTGINFQLTSSSSADIYFEDDDRNSAYAQTFGRSNTIDDAVINVGENWNGGSTRVDGYTMQTYIHEIGHALGLGHAGNYNGSARYGVDNDYLNDSWQASVMSYFSQSENTYVDASFAFVITPMMADIIAIRDLYGTAGTTRTGDTVYWNNSTAGGYLDDVASFSNPVALTIVDDGGIDTLDFSNESATQTINAYGGGESDVGGLTGNLFLFYDTDIEIVRGGSGADRINGSSVDNTFYGNNGNDYLDLRGGNDIGYGGSGSDTIRGGDGNDTVDGGTGNDTLIGGAGIDTVLFTGGTNYTVSLANWDAQNTGAGVDTIQQFENIETGSGNDVVNGNLDANVINTSGGSDVVDAGKGDDIIDGGIGEDSLFGKIGNDTINGGNDDDALFGASGNDTLRGGAGNDRLSGRDGNDLLDGGSGTDKAVFGSNGADITVDLALSGAQNTGHGVDTLIDIEDIQTGSGDDVVSGDGGANNIQTRDGDDVIDGRGGNDMLFAGDGTDTIDGGTGDDRIAGKAGNDTLTGGSGADIFQYDSGDGADTITDFEDGVDLILVQTGASAFSDVTVTDAGADTLITFDDVSIRLTGVDHTSITASDFDFELG